MIIQLELILQPEEIDLTEILPTKSAEILQTDKQKISAVIP